MGNFSCILNCCKSNKNEIKDHESLLYHITSNFPSVSDVYEAYQLSDRTLVIGVISTPLNFCQRKQIEQLIRILYVYEPIIWDDPDVSEPLTENIDEFDTALKNPDFIYWWDNCNRVTGSWIFSHHDIVSIQPGCENKKLVLVIKLISLKFRPKNSPEIPSQIAFENGSVIPIKIKKGSFLRYC